MSTFKLKVIAHDKVFYDGEAQTIIIPALDGHYQYLTGHEESVAAISEGELKIVDDKGKDIYGICSAGFLEFDNATDTCRVFVNTIELPEEIVDLRISNQTAVTHSVAVVFACRHGLLYEPCLRRMSAFRIITGKILVV